MVAYMYDETSSLNKNGCNQEKSADDKLDNNGAASTILGASSNLVNAIIGAGIVGIPFAIKEAGLVAGICLITLCAFLTEKSLRVLIESSKMMSVSSYESVMEVAFGKVGFLFVLINMFILAYGALVSYLIVIKDTLPSIIGVGDEAYDQPMRQLVLVVSSLVVVVPLSMQRDMADLAKTSKLSCVLNFLMVFLVLYLTPEDNMARNSNDNIDHNESSLLDQLGNLIKTDVIHKQSIFVGLGVLSFAFVCQHASFIIADSLHKPTKARWATVTRISLYVVGFLITIIGVCGYLGYGDETKGNILNNLDNRAASNMARACLSTTMFFVYPVESFVGRHVLAVVLSHSQIAGYGGGDDHLLVLECPRRRRNLTLGLYIAAIIPALVCRDLGKVLSLTGTVGGSCLSYFGPGMIYLGLHGKRFNALVTKSFQQYPLLNDLSVEELKTCSTFRIVINFVNRFIACFIYYVCLFPVWCKIAKVGEERRNEYEKEPEESLYDEEQYYVLNQSKCEILTSSESADNADVVEFLFAIGFILFGVIALFAGLYSLC